ncbi:pre-tRNA nuclear export protein [Elasticomyces elasticus]|nr:pre-tRNA nuclear export protein [Elasticomyces elasticus]
MDAQVESAIEIAFNPGADQNLKAQAYIFLNQIREDAGAWQVCLALFTRIPTAAEVVRHVCLEIVNNAVQTQRLDQQSLEYVKNNLMSYVQQRYGVGNAQDSADTAYIQNKLTQTITYLFVALYASSWTSFFDDFRILAGDADAIGTTTPASTSLYLRVLASIHDEIADLLIPRSPEEAKRNNELKDLIRARDASKIAVSWQAILAKWRQIDLSIVDLCLKAVSRWVGWIDISLVVNQNMLNSLLEIAGQQDIEDLHDKKIQVRDAAIDTFTETVGKKMPPSDKIEMIYFLNLSNIVGQLLASRPLDEYRTTANYDTDLAETVAKLVNNVVFDVVKALDSISISQQTRSRANELLQIFMPYLLRLFSDEYDEICSTVIPALTDLLTLFRKIVKSDGGLTSNYYDMLQPILDAIIAKMKYDETASWGDQDEGTDEAEFQDLRKRLHVLQQAVAAVSETLYMDTLSRVVATTFTKLNTARDTLNWRDVDLALHEMYLFGELATKNGGLYQKSTPSSTASSHLIEMMAKMVESDLASHSHPAVQLQYMEICVRYFQFFEQHQQQIPRVLENFVRFVRSDHVKVRTRSWYLFYKFVRQLREKLGDVAQTVIQALGDLLVIRAELPEDSAEDDMSSDENDQSTNAIFNSQLYLFEAIGCVASTKTVTIENQVVYARAILIPLYTDMRAHLQMAKNGDERARLQVHHIIMALGTLAKGFSDWQPGSTSGPAPPPSQLSAEFVDAADVILVALESLNQSIDIRTAARFAFSRMLGVLGSRMLDQLPRWIAGLLSQSSTKDEMATFLRLLDQVVFGFKTEISEILDQLLTPLLQRVFAGLAEPTTGTDDEIQLAELKLQYLNFILVILNHDLASVLVSSTNQQSFEPLLETISHFSRDPRDYSAARLALAVLTRMTVVWGGPDVKGAEQPQPTIPGFTMFLIERFSPLTWAMLSAPGFEPKDAQARNVLGEAATLQWTILKKTGMQYQDHLRAELAGMGLQGGVLEEYLTRLGGNMREFKKFFTAFVQQGQS